MARFTVRLELHGAKEADYTILHAMMSAEGFSRVLARPGAKYHLPPGEYLLEGAVSIDQAFERVDRAVKKTGKDSSVLVAEVERLRFAGLRPA